MMEGDDDGMLSWTEFEVSTNTHTLCSHTHTHTPYAHTNTRPSRYRAPPSSHLSHPSYVPTLQGFFMGAGWGTFVPSGGSSSSGSHAAASHGGQSSMVLPEGGGDVRGSVSMMSGAEGGAMIGAKGRPGDITYVVERCLDDHKQQYREVLRTSLGHATVHRLDPGAPYKVGDPDPLLSPDVWYYPLPVLIIECNQFRTTPNPHLTINRITLISPTTINPPNRQFRIHA